MDSLHGNGSTPRVLFGSTFDGVPYEISLLSDRPFGHGGSAVIHKGKLRAVTPLVVAVKVFHDFGPIDKGMQEELLERELRAAKQVSMRHPFILAFLGTADVGHQVAIVSLFMRNGNLLDYLNSHPYCDKKQLIVQVADAVNHLHTVERLAHGDLKCENILVSDYGEALLADFGLSTFVDKVQSARATMTRIRQLHTSHFAAPELLASGADAHAKPPPKSHKSDVYAFGMLILQAVTGQLPWSGVLSKEITKGLPYDVAIMLQVLDGKHPPQPVSPSGFVSISHSWWDICKRCWNQDPSHRPRMPFVVGALMQTGLEPCRRLEGHAAAGWSVSFLPDGRRGVYASRDGTISICDTVTGRTVIGPLRGHKGIVFSVAVSPDGRQICSGGEDDTIRRWVAESGAPIGNPMTGHHGLHPRTLLV